MGFAVEVILEVFISGIESFHIIYFYFHLTVSPKSLICPNKQDYCTSPGGNKTPVVLDARD